MVNRRHGFLSKFGFKKVSKGRNHPNHWKIKTDGKLHAAPRHGKRHHMPNNNESTRGKQLKNHK